MPVRRRSPARKSGRKSPRKSVRKTRKSPMRKSVRKTRKSPRKSGKRGGNGWTDAVGKARRELGITGFMAVKKGTPLYKRAKELYAH